MARTLFGIMRARSLLMILLFVFPPVVLVAAMDARVRTMLTQPSKPSLIVLAALATLAMAGGVAELWRARQTSRQASELVAVFASMTDPVLIYDAEGRVVRVNAAYVTHFGFDPTGQHRDDIAQALAIRRLDGSPASSPELAVMDALRGKATNHRRFIITNKIGDEMIIESAAAPLYDGARLVGAVVVLRDITELELARATLQQSVQESQAETERAEALAAEARQRAKELETVFAAITDPISILDADGRIVRVNAAYIASVGFDPTGQRRDDLVRVLTVRHMDGRPAPLEDIPATLALRGETAPSRQFIVTNSLGDEFITEANAAPLYDGARLVGAVAIWHNITELERARVALQRLADELREERDREEALAAEARQNAKELDTVFAAMANPVLTYDAEGRVAHVNTAAVAMFGFDPTGQHREDYAAMLSVRHLDGSAVLPDERSAAAALRGETVTNRRFVVTNARGDEIIGEANAAPLYDGSRLIGAVVVWHDITDIERARASLQHLTGQLRAEKERADALAAEARQRAKELDAVFAAMPNPVMIFDVHHHVVRANPVAVARLGFDPTGRPRDAVVSRYGFHHLDGSPVAPGELPGARALRGETVANVRLATQNYRGEDIIVEMGAAPLYDGERLTGAVLVWQDITELERARTSLQQYAARLVDLEESERRRIARELHDRAGQTLTALSIHLNIVRNQLLPEALAQVGPRLDESLQLVREATAMVREVMVELRPTVLDDYGLWAVLRWYGERFQAQTGIAVEMAGQEVAPRLPPAVETALFRIVQEALNNVAKHARASHVRLGLAGTTDAAQLTVADDGSGFDPAAQAAAGERVSWGLRTMQERAHGIGGTVRVRSAPGAGTTVIVDWERKP